MKTIGVIGTRRRNTEEDFRKVSDLFFLLYEQGDRICSGLCPQGGDWFAVLIATGNDWINDDRKRDALLEKVKYAFIRYKIESLWFPADWDKYGESAGFIRNSDIAKNSDILIACVADDRIGGTEDTIRKFIKINGSDNLYII